jgi:hypothetical protein
LDGTTVIGTGKAGAGGAWSITSSVLAAGTHTIDAQDTDHAGNAGVVSSALPVIIDTSAPAAPSTPDLAATSDSGVSPTDNITNVTTPVFSGVAEANAAITLFNGATVVGAALADAAGHWSVTSSALTQGTHAMTAKATDVAGNTGPASAAISVTIDTTAPATPSAPDLAASSDDGVSNTDNTTSVTTPLFIGTAAANSVVTLFDATTAIGSGLASAAGTWSITSSVLAAGAHSITATAADAAGNLSAASNGLSITISPTVALSANIIGLASSPNFMVVPGSGWTGASAGYWGFGGSAAGLNADTSQPFRSSDMLGLADLGFSAVAAFTHVGTTATEIPIVADSVDTAKTHLGGDYTAAHFWRGDNPHDRLQAVSVGR